ncbi:MAG: exonuclease SbcCD subunit D [Maioricimonas sp. JB049]
MSIEPFRFIHATNVRLDEPLQRTGPLEKDARQIAEDATLRAFDRIVESCIDRDVDFLLLTGNVFDAEAVTVRARNTLEKGLTLLCEADIPVYVTCGDSDPLTAWQSLIADPGNLTILSSTDDDPVAALRDGRVLASLFVVATPGIDESAWSVSGPAIFRIPDTTTWQIGLLGAGSGAEIHPGETSDGPPDGVSGIDELVRIAIEGGANYLALGEGRGPATVKLNGGVAHDPGSPQGLGPSESGIHGCTLVDVSSDGKARLTQLPTAAVRWESFSIDVDDSTSWETLVETMQLQLMEAEPQPGEQVWLIDWRLVGAGQTLQTLGEERAQRELVELIEAELESVDAPRRQHRFHIEPPLAASDAAENRAWAAWQDVLQTESGRFLGALRREVQNGDWSRSDWGRRMRHSLDNIENQQIVERSERLGREWLGHDRERQ